MPEKHIVLKNVDKLFASSGKILQNINLEIAKGEFVVLLGPSGSGKSTLLRLMAGLEPYSSGVIEVQQQNQFDKGFVFQEAHLMPWKTLCENVELPLELMGMNVNQRKEKALAALSKVGLEEAAGLYPAELSGGMKMRASLARALVGQPSLLLLDEPFAALDEQTRFQLGEDLRKLWQDDSMTIVFVTHSLHEACFLGDRVVTLSEKPAKIYRDIKIELPKIRTNELRTEVVFSEQLKKLYGALK